MADEFDINALIRDAVENGVTDPGEIAAVVTPLVPAKLLRDVLRFVLRPYVRTYLHSYPTWRQPEPEPQEKRDPRQSRSAKVGAIRAWSKVLGQPVAVEANVWKKFGQCSSEDLGFLAADRRQNAAESVAAAERFEKYQAAMDEHCAETVADLPDSAIASIEEAQ